MQTLKDIALVLCFFLYLAAYILLVAWGSDFLIGQSKWFELVYYIFFGVIWIFPAKLILRPIGGRG